MCNSKKSSRRMMDLHSFPQTVSFSRVNTSSEMHSKVNEVMLYCFNCGKVYPKEQGVSINFCKQCGIEMLKCPISKNKFHTGEKFAQCINCHVVFHYHHLLDWLEKVNTCPMCRKGLNEIATGIVGMNRLTTID